MIQSRCVNGGAVSLERTLRSPSPSTRLKTLGILWTNSASSTYSSLRIFAKTDSGTTSIEMLALSTRIPPEAAISCSEARL